MDWNGKPASDFKKQLDIYAKQTVADPATTLYTVYFGINDYIQNPAKYPVAAEAVLAALTRLQEAPFNAKKCAPVPALRVSLVRLTGSTQHPDPRRAVSRGDRVPPEGL